MPHVLTHYNPFTPSRDYRHAQVLAGTVIAELQPETDLPYICLLNGKPLLRKDWGKELEETDIVNFVVLPQGGGGSNPLRIVAMLAVIAVASWAGGPLAGSAFGSALGLSASAATAAIGLVGSALVNALIPEKTALSSSGYSSVEASSTYSVNAQGNSARIGEVIPVQYGRHRCYPDFAASPYLEYAGNEQYLYELFCIGLGEYDISDIRIEDTPITNFEEVETQIINPGQPLTLFPANVETSDEVSGQELDTNETVGPFVANAAGTTANRLAVDVVCSRGLYSIDKKGRMNTMSITFRVDARAIDDIGQATGSWVTLGTHTISAATSTPQRRSYSYAVSEGRYEVQVTRLDAKNTSTSVGHEIDWTGLKAYLVDNGNVFDGMTLMAIKIRATNNLSSTTSKKINLIATRKLQTWNPDTGWSATTVATRSIAWAFADACKSDYGGKLADRQIDLQALYDLDRVWTERGDNFDYRFDVKSTVWEALQTIARAGRAKPYKQGGMVRIMRDQPQSVPTGMFTLNNIVKDSFSIDYLMPSDDTADAVEIEYYDERIWQWKTVLCKMPDSIAEEPVSVKLLGVTDREQAWREGIYMAACNRYRRRIISLTTEKEGFIPTLGDLCWISHDMPQWGQSSVVRAYDRESLTLTLSEKMEWQGDDKTHKIALRKRDGSAIGPIVVTKGETDYQVVMAPDTVLDFEISTGMDMEPTYCTFGWDETWTQPARVLSCKPSGMYKVAIEFVGEDDAVHLADQGIYPDEIIHSQLPGEVVQPVVTGLIVRSMPGDVSTALLSWNPAPWAISYDIEQSNDLVTWTRSGDTTAPAFTCPAIYGNATYFRVRGVGTATGPWAVIAYATGAGYMWHADEDTLMWNEDETTPMWTA
ncbi:phage tail protein [Oxalobacter aliiformigenes]|uniref:phage tail protein n=1 Tax=Oxalobacter aliiformigenes TaxID=2946593 RepID=UPI0022B03218|nr:phage tail protein [Oxalobacter aliiformigenes]MCZ4065735.1 phage tail protein [Oxalobacter aliiformigenes]WAV98633.1 phage tail protein [Oxalobacter aliiformigenes]